MKLWSLMNTADLLALVTAAYPDKTWSLEPFDAEGEERNAIMLAHEGTAVHDPLLTVCGRFFSEDRYGLSEDHARLIRRHNRRYERYVMHSMPDLEVVFDILVQAAKTRLTEDPVYLLDDLGFSEYHTGGGCMAYALFDSDRRHILVTETDGSSLPEYLGDSTIGLYDGEGDEARVYHPAEPLSVLYRATISVHGREFEGYGTTSEKATDALKLGLTEHSKRHLLGDAWWSTVSIRCYAVGAGAAYVNQTLLVVTDEPAPQRYQVMFPSFGVLDVEIPEGFVDESDRNAAFPAFVKELSNGNRLMLMIDFANKADREFRDHPRFELALYDHEMEHQATLAVSEDYQDILTAIAYHSPEPTPYQFLRQVMSMTRAELNDWYAGNVGRPYDEDDGEVAPLLKMRLDVAEMMYYHAKGVDNGDWDEEGAQRIVNVIANDALQRTVDDRRFKYWKEGYDGGEAIEVVFTFFGEQGYSEDDQRQIADLQLSETLHFGDRSSLATIVRIH